MQWSPQTFFRRWKLVPHRIYATPAPDGSPAGREYDVICRPKQNQFTDASSHNMQREALEPSYLTTSCLGNSFIAANWAFSGLVSAAYLLPYRGAELVVARWSLTSADVHEQHCRSSSLFTTCVLSGGSVCSQWPLLKAEADLSPRRRTSRSLGRSLNRCNADVFVYNLCSMKRWLYPCISGMSWQIVLFKGIWLIHGSLVPDLEAEIRRP